MKGTQTDMVAGFSADWLNQREPFDTQARARAARLLGLDEWLGTLVTEQGGPRIIDLACGTGASLRALAPLLGGRQRWLVVDHDEALLARWPLALAGYASSGTHGTGRHEHHDKGEQDDSHDASHDASHDDNHEVRVEQRGSELRLIGNTFDAAIERRRLDLAVDLESLPFGGAALVTASALLDLVSAEWLRRLVRACKAAGASALFALTVDGRHDWTPHDHADSMVARLFAAHQARDKGFGPALGAKAAATAARAFVDAGYAIRTARSDWFIDASAGGDASSMLRSMIDGMAGAAIDQAPSEADAIRRWQARRVATAGHATLRVGHVDFMASLPHRPAQSTPRSPLRSD